MAYNVREGLRREHFKILERFLKDPILFGFMKGQVAEAGV